MFKHWFPTFGIKNIGIYYLLGIFLNGWFILPNWVFYLSEYLNLQQIGLVDGLAILVGVVMEVPSGALSDLWGKRKTLLAGSVLMIMGGLMWLMGREFWMFLWGNVLIFIAFAFQSGSTEAFAYDSLIEKGLKEKYSVVAARYASISIILSLLSIFAGGFLYALDPRLPLVAWMVFLLMSTFLLYLVKEPKIDSVVFSFTSYKRQLSEGFTTLFGKALKIYLIPLLTIATTAKLYQGVVRQGMGAYFGYDGETFGYLLGLVMIPAILLSFKFDVIKKWIGERRLLVASLLAYGFAFALASIWSGLTVGALVFLLLMTTEKFAQPLISVIINDRVESKHRATTLSTVALLAQIPYILLMLMFAQIVESTTIRYLFAFIILILVLSLGWVIVNSARRRALMRIGART